MTNLQSSDKEKLIKTVWLDIGHAASGRAATSERLTTAQNLEPWLIALCQNKGIDYATARRPKSLESSSPDGGKYQKVAWKVLKQGVTMK